MLLEAHLTVTLSNPDELVLREWLERRPLERTDIELAKGSCRRQVMLSGHFGHELAGAQRAMAGVRDALSVLGIAVVRTKLEAAMTGALPPSLYIEHHVKVRVGAGDAALLGDQAVTLGAHVSRNPRRSFVDHEERFLTQRFPAGAVAAADAGLSDLLAALAAREVTVLRVEREHVIADDNLGLDAGWASEVSS